MNYHLSEFVRKGEKTREYILYSGTDAPAESGKAPDVIAPEAFGVRVSDGRSLLSYYSTRGSSDVETQKGRAVLESLDARAFAGMKKETGTILGDTDGVSLSAILQDQNCMIRREMVTYEGNPACIVECPVEIGDLRFDVKYWLAPDKSGLPLRMEMRDEEGNLFKLSVHW